MAGCIERILDSKRSSMTKIGHSRVGITFFVLRSKRRISVRDRIEDHIEHHIGHHIANC